MRDLDGQVRLERGRGGLKKWMATVFCYLNWNVSAVSWTLLVVALSSMCIIILRCGFQKGVECTAPN